MFEHCYRFKQLCKKGEQLLRQVPLTGVWPKELPKPKFLYKEPKVETKNILDVPLLLADLEPQLTENLEIPQKLGNVTITRTKPAIVKPQTDTNSQAQPKKLLNANPAKSPEPPAPKRAKKEVIDVEDDPTTIFLNKVENDEELSIEDLHRFIEANTAEDVTDEFKEKVQPKVLNKSSVRILNKEANKVIEPKFKRPQVKLDKAGNVAVVTEIIDPTDCYIEQERSLKDVPEVPTDVFPCPHCERSFPLRQLRDIHVVIHTRERSNPCQQCDKSFFSKYDLQKHVLTHTGEKPFVCSICNKAFTRSTLLHRHERLHTDVPKYICLYCEKTFISKEEMEKHAERHTKKRPFQCSVCNKSFAFKQGLERHMTTHSSDQPFPCHYCDQTFLTASKLGRHLTAHAGRRPYPCRFCPKSFLLSHHLTRHLRNHKHSAANFECHSCKSVFNNRADLVQHTAEHTRLSLVCVLCREQLPSEDKVDEHIAKHVSSESHGCEFCDLMFLSDQCLQNHISEDHAEDLLTYIEDDKKQEKTTTEKDSAEKKNGKQVSPNQKKPIKGEKIEKETNDEQEFLESINEYLLDDDDDDLPLKIAAKEESIEYIEEDIIQELANEAEQAESIQVELLNNSKEVNKAMEIGAETVSTRKRRSDSKADTTAKEIKVETKVLPTKRRPFAAVKTGGVKVKAETPVKPNIVITKSSSKETKEVKTKPTAAATTRSTRTSNGTAANEEKEQRNKPVAVAGTSAKTPKNSPDSGTTSKKLTNAQKIDLSKTDVSTMAKQGRLRIKDGKIVLTRRSNEK